MACFGGRHCSSVRIDRNARVSSLESLPLLAQFTRNGVVQREAFDRYRQPLIQGLEGLDIKGLFERGRGRKEGSVT